MQVKEITVMYGATMNVGDFNSARMESSVTAVLDEGDDPEACRAELLASARRAVQEVARGLAKKPKARVAEVLQGLPVDVAANLKEKSSADSRIN